MAPARKTKSPRRSQKKSAVPNKSASGSSKTSKRSKSAGTSKKRSAKNRVNSAKGRVKPAGGRVGFEESDCLSVRGASEHNLKSVNIDLPKNRLIVFTGVSGSGKSSLAFDTIFSEGQRRYVESLSAYARQFLGQLEKPRFETIRGLSPAIAIEQKAASKNPRSTVGTITEIYDYLRVLYARVGTQYCVQCGQVVGRGHAQGMVERILEVPDSTRVLLLAPLVENRKGEHRELFAQLRKDGYVRIRIDGVVRELSDIQSLAKNKKHNIEVVVDRLAIKKTPAFIQRLTDSVETGLKIGHGKLILHILDREDIAMSEARSCCGIAYPELDPPVFSFNSPQGMCVECHGLGTVVSMDIEKVIPDPTLSIREGAIVPWRSNFEKEESKEGSWGMEKLRAIEKQWKIDFDKPWKKLSKSARERILWGSDKESDKITVAWKGKNAEAKWTTQFEGIMNSMFRRFEATQSDRMKMWYGRFMSSQSCPSCQGARLKPEPLHVRIQDQSIIDVTRTNIREAHDFLSSLDLTKAQEMIAGELLREICSRLEFLINVGLGYLSMDRKGPTLSGGEAQRIRLASQIGSELTGVLYVLDEPSIGLHQRDNQKLLATLKHLRDIGNTLIVVEHDQETIEAADWVVDIGPGAGHLGGQIVASGPPKQLIEEGHSRTAKYLNGEESIEVPKTRRTAKQTSTGANSTTSKKTSKGSKKEKGGPRSIRILGAKENNLKNVNASLPLGLFTAITGVSGAGKSTLINQILYPALSRALHDTDIEVGAHDHIEGLEALDKVINIDQKPIGRTPRSNPATYTKVFDLIRDVFALMPESKTRGYSKGRFSFNVKGGRCEPCHGDGYVKVEMHFLADVFVPCEECQGRRFNDATLEILCRGHSIADVLDLSVLQAREIFENHPKIRVIMDTLIDVGLDYIKLGQAATTLSGGEAQRIKLSRELSKRDTGRTLYILDEPTTGLHFDDIRKLLSVLQRLVDAGNTVVVIEHNLDVIKCADWILDIGPEGGDEGGLLVAEGPPEVVAKQAQSSTGQFLKPLLNTGKRTSKSSSRRLGG